MGGEIHALKRREIVMNRLHVKLFFFLAVFGTVLNANASTLTIGRVSNDPEKTHKQLKPILDYVVDKLRDVGVVDGAIRIAKDQNEMVGYLKQGKVDWVQKGVFDALVYQKDAGVEIALRSWREQVPNYYSIIFSRKDSSVGSLKDLVGKKIAFQDKDSTSAFFVPSAVLRKAGFELVELSSPRETVPHGKIGYVFAGKELSITTWVHRGLADAGAYHNQNWQKPADNPEGMKKDLRIIYQGRPMPRMIEMFAKVLDPKVKTKLKQVLLHAHEDPAAADALKAYGPDTTKFDEFNGKTKDELTEAMSLAKFMKMPE
jgi:phosphate/phosphite/phosphonate ABC transporter binding protein